MQWSKLLAQVSEVFCIVWQSCSCSISEIHAKVSINLWDYWEHCYQVLLQMPEPELFQSILQIRGPFAALIWGKAGLKTGNILPFLYTCWYWQVILPTRVLPSKTAPCPRVHLHRTVGSLTPNWWYCCEIRGSEMRYSFRKVRHLFWNKFWEMLFLFLLLNFWVVLSFLLRCQHLVDGPRSRCVFKECIFLAQLWRTPWLHRSHRTSHFFTSDLLMMLDSAYMLTFSFVEAAAGFVDLRTQNAGSWPGRWSIGTSMASRTSLPHPPSSLHATNSPKGDRNACPTLIPPHSSHFGVAHGWRPSSAFCHCQQPVAGASRGWFIHPPWTGWITRWKQPSALGDLGGTVDIRL